MLGVRRHSKASDAVLEYRRVPLAQRGRKSGLVRDTLTRCLAPGARHAADGPTGDHACVPQRSVRLCWSTDGVDAKNLARQRNLQQGRHQSQTLGTGYDGVTSALGVDAGAARRTAPVTSRCRSHPPTRASGARCQLPEGRRERAPPGDQPKNWRATGPRNGGHQSQNWTGRRYVLNTVGNHGMMVWGLVFEFWALSG